MAKGGGGGGQQAGTTTTDPYQSGAFDRLLAGAGTQLSRGFFDKQFAGGMETRAGQTDEQRALQDRLVKSQGTVDLAMGGLERQLGPYDANNPALMAAIDAASGDVTRNLQENLLPSIGDNAGQAGQFGSTRHGIAEGVALRGANEQVGDIATQMRLADMQAHQQGQQSALANLGSTTSGIEFAASGQQREEQSRLDDLFARWEYESGVPLQNLMAEKGLISGDMGGTSHFKPDDDEGK